MGMAWFSKLSAGFRYDVAPPHHVFVTCQQQSKRPVLNRSKLFILQHLSSMAAIDSATELSSLLEQWDEVSENGGDPKPLLRRIAELVEQDTEAWYKMDPDPFDYRHPGRADPTCTLGHLLKALFKNDSLMTKLVNEYLSGDHSQVELQSLSCRLLLDVMPGLETTVVFQDNEELVQRLMNWAQTATDPLRAYATGLLMGAMEVQDIAANFKDTNAELVPTMLRRLRDLQQQSIEKSRTVTPAVKCKLERPFANIGSDHGKSTARGGDEEMFIKRQKTDASSSCLAPLGTIKPTAIGPHDGATSPVARNSLVKSHRLPTKECSNSSWAEMEPYVIGSYCMSPLTSEMHQRLILQYLTPLGEYQELLCHVFEQNAMELIFYYIDLSRNRDVRLAFEAHKYLAALLCHKKFAIEFINLGGVQRLLEVVRPSVAATGVSMCLYYLAYFDVAMERVCLLTHRILSDLVSYVLWLLECSHESGRCHAIMFFSLAFQYRVLLELFDLQDGLRKLFNVTKLILIAAVTMVVLVEVDGLRDGLGDGLGDELGDELGDGLGDELGDGDVVVDVTYVRYQLLQEPGGSNEHKHYCIVTTTVSRHRYDKLVQYFPCLFADDEATANKLAKGILNVSIINVSILNVSIINVSIINAYVLWTAADRPLLANTCLFSVNTFKLQLIQDLCDGNDVRPHRMSAAVDNLHIQRVISDDIVDGQPLVSRGEWLVDHFETNFGCSTCKVYLGEVYLGKVYLGMLGGVLEISTMEILNFEESGTVAALTEDELFTSRQAARHVCLTLKKYFEAHLAIKADQVRRAHMRNEGGSPLAESPSYKACKLAPEVIQDNVELLLECLPLRMQWLPVAQLTRLGGITKLMQLIAMAAEWNAFSAKAETIRSALDVLSICSVTPKTQLLLCESVLLPENVSTQAIRERVDSSHQVGLSLLLPENVSTQAISILLGLAEGEIMAEPDVQKAALSVIINCVCGPMSRLSSGVGRIITGSAKKKLSLKNGEDLLVKMWHTVRTNNGIMVLLKLLMTKTPITEADAIRALACKSLVGLARCDTVKQIISKLPLFTDGQLQQLMKEPILQDKRQQHVKFCKCASELIESVLGKPQNASIEASLERIRKADVVAQTKIIYQEKELLQLIHEHLLAKGLQETAEYLLREAELPGCNSLPPCPTIHAGVTISAPSLLNSPKAIRHHTVTANAATPQGGHHGNHSLTNKPVCSTPTGGGPVKLNIINCKMPQPVSHARSQKIIQAKNDCVSSYYHQSPLSSSSSLAKKVTGTTCHEPSVSLDEIVTEYLRKQHASCTNPVVTCPPFSLLTPHRCPDPQHKNTAPCNFTSRLLRRSCYPRHGGPSGEKLNRKFIYSRFRPVRTYSDSEEDRCFSCCAFSFQDPHLYLCTQRGEIKVYDVSTAQDNIITHLWKFGQIV
ncbi:DDB1- and CUL4-associated factor 1 [Lamellibrachia satsuma]|nr:DDB1- and CUL4-associated factor 1 [Lamellibrachia satsuma]